MPYEVTDRKTVDFGDGYTVTVEIHNTEEAFRWRMVDSDDIRTDYWTGNYSSLLTLEGRRGTVVYASDYWAGYLPTEQPFLVVTGKEVQQ